MYENTPLDHMLPGQYVSEAPLTPEEELLVAVIEDAHHVLIGGPGKYGTDFFNALWWVHSHQDYIHCFSLESICNYLNMESEVIRGKLIEIGDKHGRRPFGDDWVPNDRVISRHRTRGLRTSKRGPLWA